MCEQIAALGCNTSRLPYSNQLFDAASQPTDINYDINPDLRGLRGLALMDKIIDAAGRRGLRIILDQHRPNADAQSGLLYTHQLSQARWVPDAVLLAQHHPGNAHETGACLRND